MSQYSLICDMNICILFPQTDKNDNFMFSSHWYYGCIKKVTREEKISCFYYFVNFKHGGIQIFLLFSIALMKIYLMYTHSLIRINIFYLFPNFLSLHSLSPAVLEQSVVVLQTAV